MPKTKEQKEAMVSTLVEKFGRMRSAVFANYEGLSVKEIEELRHQLKQGGVEYLVAKKTLLNIAMKQAGKAIEPKTIAGNFATAIAYEDEIAPARIIATFGKQHEALEIVAGVLEDTLIDAEKVQALAKLPSKSELLAITVRTIQAPISGFVNVLAGNLRGLVGVLNAIKETKA
jgi:large subunit ribosomal protein L10